MKKSASELRAIARAGLKGNWLVAILTAILAGILGVGSGLNLNFNFNIQQDIENSGEFTTQIQSFWEQIPEETKALIFGGLATATTVGLIISIAQYIIGSAAELGYNKFNLDIVDGKEVNVTTIFSRFNIFVKAVGLRLFIGIFTFLWMLLFLIPGIIASYRYAMASYIMAENPNVGIREAVNISKKMMKGYKWRYFCLEISFIGWILLSLFTCFIGMIWVVPYINAAKAAFYRMVADNYYGTPAENV